MGAHPNAGDTRAWRERLGWTFGLVSEDPLERAAALAQLVEVQRLTREALRKSNELWRLASSLGPEEHYKEPAFLQARQRYIEARSHSLPDGLWEWPWGGIAAWPGLPYALLYLEWEAKYPEDWTRYAKSWGTKKGLLRHLDKANHHHPSTETKLADLVVSAVERPYRCEDRWYARLARAIDNDDLRARLGHAAQSDNPWARYQASFVLWLLTTPDAPVSRHTWSMWLATRDTPKLGVRSAESTSG
ncbi:hypothetical protein HUT06_25190 [Actinomadura sp. NAK00032]|uniref:hypothetical protein n=1 Tax=Actinomadura sp. NAK00032 TaxID=2742128 RepID=UPI00159280E1|nr:hypothetical protein [Actinomadura sp. NAK00032]QKW36908.1 hypothetical protein HUT06_25190 [Actinomadura sp. NAK00032]